MNYIILILKGFLIGIGKIIPGVSGAMIAISLNIYQKGVESISSFFKNIKENIKFLLPICIGVLIGIILFSKIIINLLSTYYLQTMLLFIGLIIGGVMNIKKNVSLTSKSNLIELILIFLLTFIMTKINAVSNNEYNFLIMIIMGFIEAITMIVPGISGTAILMSLGYYDLIITSFSTINLLVLFPFVIGLVIGIIMVTKLINFLFINYKDKTYIAILGFSFSSIVLMFLMTFNKNYSLSEIFIGLILMILGYNITKLIEK